MNSEIRSRAPPRESAPYGRACAGCSKAKCRCMLRGDGIPCERCHRLQMDCLPSQVVRKRLARKPASRRTAVLEDKLDSLVNLLKLQAQDTHGIDAPDGEDAARGSTRSTSQGAREESGASDAYPTPDTSEALYPPESSPHEAQDCFRDFCRLNLSSFPFIRFSSDTTVEHLRSEWPFLWLVIRTNCCKSTAKRRQLEGQIRKIASQKLLIDLERSMDLLVGLIAYISWTSDKYQGKPLLNAFSGLALALLRDLRLDRAAQEQPWRKADGPEVFCHPPKAVIHPLNRTNVDRRAVLGCYLSCAYTAWFLKNNSPTWTPYMEDCMRHMMAAAEYDGDWILITQVRLSKMLEDVNTAASWRPADGLPTQSAYQLAMMHVKASRAALQEVRETTPPEILEDRRVQSYLHATEAMVNEIPLFPIGPDSRGLGTIDFERSECFYACIQAIKRCLDNFFTFTPEEIFGLPMSVQLHFSRCTHVLYRLHLMDDLAWNRSAISTSIDVLDVISRCAELYTSIPSAVGLETDGTDMFNRMAEVLRSTVPMWRRGLEEAGAIPAVDGPPGHQAGTPAMSQELAMMDLSIDGWFSDIFSVNETF